MSQKQLIESVSLDDLPDDFGLRFTPTIESTAHGEIDPAKVSLPKPFVVVIIGSGKGIGASIAKAYALAGASGIVLSSRTMADLKCVEAEILQINPETKTLCQGADIADEASLIALATKVKEAFGRLDVAVVNAGTAPKVIIDAASKKRFPIGTIEDPTADFMRVWNTNFTGYYYANKAFLPLLLETKDGAQAFVCTSSVCGHVVSTDIMPFAYNLSKFALNRLVEIIHESHHKDGIVAYAMNPGGIQTPLVEDYPEGWAEVLLDDISLPGGFCVWLTKVKREWLSGRYVSANWNTEELEGQKDEIVTADKLKYKMVV